MSNNFTNILNNAKMQNLSYEKLILNASQPATHSPFYSQYKQNQQLLNDKMRNLVDDNSYTKMIDPSGRDMSNKSPTLTNQEGLGKAYSATDKLYQNNDTLYIAGTSSAQDVIDDLKIPFDKVDKSVRYQDANKIIEQNIIDGHPIKNLISHSLGGSVSLKLVQNYSGQPMKSTTYGAPILTTSPNQLFSTTIAGNRYRHPLDPVSMLDQASKTIPIQDPSIINPHSYDGYNGLDED